MPQAAPADANPEFQPACITASADPADADTCQQWILTSRARIFSIQGRNIILILQPVIVHQSTQAVTIIHNCSKFMLLVIKLFIHLSNIGNSILLFLMKLSLYILVFF